MQQIETNSIPIKLLLVGDTGTGKESQFKVAAALEKRCQELGGIDGLVMLGDNFYWSGVSSPIDLQWQKKIERPYSGQCLSNAPIYPVLGNHDYRGSVDAQVAYSTTHQRWNLPYRFYRIDFSDILRLTFFDSGFPDFCFLEKTCAVDFMRESFRSSEGRWNIALAHHPLASASVKGHSHSGGLFGFLMKPFVCGAADFWISGHAHHLEHRKEFDCDTELFVSGGGGADLYPVIKEQKEIKFVESQHGFLQMEITKDNIKSSFYDDEARLLYSSNKSR
jgi:predicted MPP superfamily phosphohydrolase